MTAYTALEFFEAVLELRPRVAVFDCDGTLWAPDSGHGFMEWSFAQGLVSAEARRRLEGRYQEYEAGLVDEETICGEMVRVYAGLGEQAIEEAAALFFREEVAGQVFPEMLRVAQALAEGGSELWAVSSTARWVVAAGVAEAGFPIVPERVLAAEVKVEEGRLTDRVTLLPTGEGKRRALEGAGVTRPDAAFGNSVHDGAMLRMALRAFPVNPSPALRQLAEGEGWRIYLPAGQTGQSVGGEAAGASASGIGM